MQIFQMSFAGSVLIVAVVVIRSIGLNKLPKKTFMVLWGVTLCRLLVPFSIPSRFSFYTGLDILKRLFTETEATVFPVQITGIPPATIISDTAVIIGTDPSVFSGLLIKIVWLTGFCICLLFFAAAYIKCRREFKMSLPVTNGFAALWLREHPLRRPVQIRQSDKIKAPLTYGVFRPVILLPKKIDWTDETKLQHIFAHEHMHIRYIDTLKKLLLAAALCVHWFNPFVWVMYILANRDIELSCDEAVVRIFGRTMKSAYALTLIGLEEKKSGLTPLVNNFSKNVLEERINAIMKMKKTSLVGIILAVALVTGITTVFATNAVADTPAATAVSDGDTAMEDFKIDFSLYNSRYKEYGLVYDKTTNKLTYLGKPVRYFEDFYPVDNGNAGIDFFDKTGSVDVHAIRDLTPIKNSDGSLNPAGKLLGLEQSSQEEFNSKDISNLLNPPQTYAIETNASSSPDTASTAQESSQDNAPKGSSASIAYSVGDKATPEELAELYAVYEPFGLTYDKKQDCLYYDGKLVRQFVDILSSNGESLTSGKFKGSMRQVNSPDGEGEIELEAVRDYTITDAEGYGKLVGIAVTN